MLNFLKLLWEWLTEPRHDPSYWNKDCWCTNEGGPDCECGD